jgi:hypothetical protein
MGYSNRDELTPGMIEGTENMNEDFLAKVQQQTDKIKAMCAKEYPEDKRQRKACIGHHKAKWINSLKHESEECPEGYHW